jgi:signal transduction histidine kinase
VTGSADRRLTRFVRRRWRLCAALAIGLGLLQATPELFEGEELGSIALRCLLWALEIPIEVIALSITFDRVVRRRVDTPIVVLASVLVAIAVGAIHAFGFVGVVQGVLGLALDEHGPLDYLLITIYGAIGGVVVAAIWALAFVSPYLSEQAQRRRTETDQLRVAAELAHLRSQLEPHFLLNTLNTIAGLVAQRPSEARRLLGCLGDLLRDALHGDAELQTLEREVTWLRRYAEILESRHGDAIRFDWDIGADASEVLLPRLLLQPLVENAVQHGALCRAGGGRVAVRASLQEVSAGPGPTLVCTVSDNGPGLATSEPRTGALGLHTVRRRLELQCPGSVLRLQSSSEGTVAIIEVPVPGAGVA